MVDVLTAKVTTPGDPDDVLVDINDEDNYSWDPQSDLGSLGIRRVVLEAANVDGGTEASNARPLHVATLVINLTPQADMDTLVDNYAALKEALDARTTLLIELPGYTNGGGDTEFLIDCLRCDAFPNLVSGRLPWVPGCEPRWYADTLVLPLTRHPYSYGAGTFL